MRSISAAVPSTLLLASSSHSRSPSAEARGSPACHFVSIVSVVVQRQRFTRELAKAIQRIGALGVICCPREPVFKFGLRLDLPGVSRGVISNRILCRVGIAQRRKPRPPIIGTKGCMSCGRESVSHTTARRSPRTSAPRTWYSSTLTRVTHTSASTHSVVDTNQRLTGDRRSAWTGSPLSAARGAAGARADSLPDRRRWR
jgi:hypothetical protein